MFRAAAVLALVCALLPASTETQLIGAARAGNAGLVEDLLGRNPNLEARDKDGKTALIWAAEEGHADVVKLLLAKGADPQARDKEGFMASDRALFCPPAKRPAVLAVLPKRDPLRIDIVARWLPVNMIGSCFESRPDLAQTIVQIAPDEMALGAFANYARAEGQGAVEIVRGFSEGLKPDANVKPLADAAATVVLVARPGVTCSAGADHLTLAIDVKVLRTGAVAAILQRTYGGGLKGLHDRTVENVTEYGAAFDEWARLHASAIYWDVLRALLRP
jgi:ankyrin repeat protein